MAAEINPPAQTPALEEVIVSARKRDERLQDVPVAVTAFSEQQLRDQNLQTVTDLSTTTPSLRQSYLSNAGGSA
ncbi:MAG: hypothetical protein ABW110_22680, partial [Steroidobacteraceae bacterium]